MAIRIYIDESKLSRVLAQVTGLDELKTADSITHTLRVEQARVRSNIDAAQAQLLVLQERIQYAEGRLAAQSVIDAMVPEVRALLEHVDLDPGPLEVPWLRETRRLAHIIGDRLGEE